MSLKAIAQLELARLKVGEMGHETEEETRLKQVKQPVSCFIDASSRFTPMKHDQRRKTAENGPCFTVSLLKGETHETSLPSVMIAPRNEAEAALAAQAVAVHFATMKLAHNLAGRSCPDSRTLAALAALSKAYVRQIEAMHSLKGRKVSRQKITVRNERHVHHHQHVHVDRGVPNSGGQPYGPHAALAEPSSALPRTHSTGVVVPMPCKSR